MSQINYRLARPVVAVMVVAAVLAGLAAWPARDGRAGAPDEPDPAPRTFIHEREFAEQPELAALPRQVVILDLEPASAAQPLRENVARYQFNDGTYNFCLDKGDPHLTHLTLEDESGTPLAKVERGDECRQATLAAGVHTMRLWHDGGAISGAGRVAFVRAPRPTAPLLNSDGTPRGGYWALRPDPASDPTGQGREGRLRALPPPQFVSDDYPKVMPVMADWESQQVDDYALFYLRNGSLFGDNPPPQVLAGNSLLNVTSGLPSPYLFADAGMSLPFFDFYSLSVLDLTQSGGESYTAQLQATALGVKFPFILDNNSRLNMQTGGNATKFRVLFRFFPDGTQVGQLDEGEVALFQQCDYQGKAVVLIADTPDFAALTSSVITLDKSTASIRLGNNTAVTLHSGGGFSGTSQVVPADTPCLDDAPIGRNTTSIQVSPLVLLLLAKNSCENCQLAGVDLSGQDLDMVDLRGADLTGANLSQTTMNLADLTGATLRNADLSHAVLTGAKLDSADLTGANLSYTELGLVVLDGATLTSANLTGASLPGIDLSRTVLTNAQLNSADLTGANLTGIRLQSLAGSQNAVMDQVTGLAGSDLSQIVLSGVSLQQVDLSNANLTGAQLDGANLTGANLTGANLTGANLTGASLPGIDLSRTVLTNAQLNSADLTGANLTGVRLQSVTLLNAIMDQVTGLAGADLSQVDLSGASLRRVDLNTAKLYGARLDGANLEGSNLSGAFLTNNPLADITDAVRLVGARLKNVNLSNAQLSGADFTNANFYGSAALGEKTCDINDQGFTVGCATAAGATMNNTQFGGAYLYGVDFTNTTVQSVQFGGAVLIGANFAGAKLSTDSNIGKESGFTGAFLQGANLASANLNGTSLLNAFVDFRQTGNDMYLRLDGNHTTFAGWPTPGQRVCVFAFYTGPTTVPTSNTTIICPDRSAAGAQGCGPTEASNTRWRSLVEIDQTSPPGSYLEDATYTKAAETPICSPFNANW